MIRFTEDMQTGIPNIDAQHRSLVDFANRAATLSSVNPSWEEMKECLDFLGGYVIRHFEDEEAMQAESAYPRYGQHKQIHGEFVHTFESLLREFDKHGPSEALSSTLNNRVANWIITHIRMEDAVFGKHYRAFCAETVKA